jgi:hypothetical protein
MFELYLLLFLLFIILLIVISSLKIGISPMPSSKKVANTILELAKVEKEKIIIDLGSGFGSLAIYLASNIPDKKVIAYELSLIPFLISLFLKKLFNIKNLEIYRKDFLNEELKGCVLVCYLFPKGMKNLEDKIFDETINTKIISSTFSFRNIKERGVYKVDDIFKTPIYYYST